MVAEILYKTGTTITLSNSAGATANISLQSLADTKARQSVKFDFGATRAPSWAIYPAIESGTVAPTAGETILFYLSGSNNATPGSFNMGGTTGTDIVYKDGEESEWVKQLELIGISITTNDIDTVQRMRAGTFSPGDRYGSIVVWNESGRALANTDNNHEIILMPIIPESQ